MLNSRFLFVFFLFWKYFAHRVSGLENPETRCKPFILSFFFLFFLCELILLWVFVPSLIFLPMYLCICKTRRLKLVRGRAVHICVHACFIFNTFVMYIRTIRFEKWKSIWVLDRRIDCRLCYYSCITWISLNMIPIFPASSNVYYGETIYRLENYIYI